MEGLGRQYNLGLSQIAANKRIYVGETAAFALIVVDPAANLVTVQQHTLAAAGSSAALNFTKRYNQTADVWAEVAQASGNTFTPAGTEDFVVVEFDTRALADGFKYVSASIATAGTIIWHLHDLEVQRKPVNLRSVSA